MGDLAKYEYIDGYPVSSKYEELYSEHKPELEERNPVTIKTTKGRIKAISGENWYAYSAKVRHKGSGVVKDLIVIPHNVPKDTRIHEIAHWKLGDTGSTHQDDWEDIAFKELRADNYSRKVEGKRLNIGELQRVGWGLVHDGCSANRAMSAIKGAVSRLGYSLPKEYASKVWWYLREEERGF